jgi:hypothetical protein
MACLDDMNATLNHCIRIFLLVVSLNSHAEDAESKGILDTVGNLYSDTELQVKLAIAQDALHCSGTACDENLDFDARVTQFGAELSANAYALFPTLKRDVPEFAFTVAEKGQSGTASNKLGHVVVFRGTQDLLFSDQALKFLLAREMAHVIAKHHDKNVSTKLIISALTAVAFPAVAILAVSQAAAEVSTVTSVVTSAASTATSLVGSEVAMAKLKPSQRLEADKLAMKLIDNEDLDILSMSAEFLSSEPRNAWEQDLLMTSGYLITLIETQEPEAKDDSTLLDQSQTSTQEDATAIGQSGLQQTTP